ncbi:hypothetical protein FJY69_03140 [candidate division WOR-3 bacterium]|nr:hypothetical protein [candidate division WOR-3 bacterium]
MESRQQLEFRIKFACNAMGVRVGQSFSYLNFGRSVARAEKTIHGSELVAHAAGLVEHYARQGLDRKVMYKLLSDVFTIRPDRGWPKT